MPVYRLTRALAFPDPEEAEPEGLLAVGGDLSVERLILAYSLGIFPWYSRGEPILWWSPDPRLVLRPDGLHVGRSLRRVVHAGRYEVRADTAFAEVVEGCATRPRPGQDGTWLVPAMRAAYLELHARGVAHSVEAWEEGRLAGGLYGVSLGGIFFGESMYADRPDASKVAFVRLVETLRSWDFDLVDCQVETAHLVRFGARPMARREFRALVARSLAKPHRSGRWVLPAPATAAAAERLEP